MQLFDIIDSSDPKERKQVERLAHFANIGGSGTDISAGVFSEDYFQKLQGNEAADIYDEMRRGDDQVKMLTRVVKNPIVSASWSITPVDDSDEEKEIADFISFNLFDNMGNPATGKIKTWSEFIREAMTCVDFGYSLFELVHKVVLNDPIFGDYIGIKDLGWRSPKTIEEWNLNQDGSIHDVYQITEGDLQRSVHIPGDFLMVISPHKEGDNYEGISDLRPIYGNWFRKNFLRKAQMIGIERAATGVPVGNVPGGMTTGEGIDPDYAEFKRILAAFVMHQKNYLILPEGYSITELKIPHDAEKVAAAIDQENIGMTKSFLANFMELGMGKTGSQALSSDISSMFLSGIEYYSDLIIERVNLQVIRGLVNAKYGKRRYYPKLTVGGIKDKAGKELADILKILKDADLIQSSDKLKTFVHDIFKLPEYIQGEDEEGIEPDGEEGEDKTILSEVQTIVFNKTSFTKKEAKEYLKNNFYKSDKFEDNKTSLSFQQSPSKRYDRFKEFEICEGVKALVGFEKDEPEEMRFVDQKNTSLFISDESKKALDLMQPQLKERGDKYIESIIKKMATVPKSKVRIEVSKLIIPAKSVYKKSLLNFYSDLAVQSTDDTLKELGLPKNTNLADKVEIKALPGKTKQSTKAEVELLVESQDNDMMKNLLFSFNQNVDNLSEAQMLEQLTKVEDDYIEGASVRASASNSTATIVNASRNAVFQTKEVFETIESFIFTNSDPQAAVCVNLAGRVFTKQEYLTTDKLPPLHHNCNSYITVQRSRKAVTNKPINPIGLNYTGTDIQVQQIVKSKKF